jgi:hypothetical protein
MSEPTTAAEREQWKLQAAPLPQHRYGAWSYPEARTALLRLIADVERLTDERDGAKETAKYWWDVAEERHVRHAAARAEVERLTAKVSALAAHYIRQAQWREGLGLNDGTIRDLRTRADELRSLLESESLTARTVTVESVARVIRDAIYADAEAVDPHEQETVTADVIKALADAGMLNVAPDTQSPDQEGTP